MDHSSAQKIISDVESNVNVNEFIYKGYYVWPLMKHHFYFGLRRFDESKSLNNSKTKTEVLIHKIGLLNKIKGHFNNINILLLNFLKHQLEISKYKKKIVHHDAVFSDVANNLYEDNVENKNYSRYISPYLELLQEKFEVTLLNINENQNIVLNKIIKPYHFNTSYYFNYLKVYNHYFNRNKNDLKISNYSKLIDYISDTFYNNILNENLICIEINKVIQFEKLWLGIFSSVKPKVVFLSCFYGNVSHSGMIAAAKKLNIKTIEVQHGLALGTMYLGWETSPVNGYDFLPDNFWCWSKFDFDEMQKSRGNSNEFKPIVGGNLWFAKNFTHNFINESNLELDKIIEGKKSRKIILVTLQHSVPFAKHLIDAISESPVDWLWLVRFHPRDYIDKNYRQNYINALSGFSNVEYEYSTMANLYPIIRKANAHITHFSTVAVECISFKVPTILLDNQAEVIFRKFIESGNFHIANTNKEILNFIESNISINNGTFDYFKLHNSGEIPSEISELMNDN